MKLLLGLLIFTGSSLALPASREERNLFFSPKYQLRTPANVLVDYGPGLTASTVLRIQEPTIPTNNLVSKFLQNDYPVFSLTPSGISSITQHPVFRTTALAREFNSQPRNMPWSVFLKKEEMYGVPIQYRNINLSSINPTGPWEIAAYALAPPGVFLPPAEYTVKIPASPVTFFPSLFVSPYKSPPLPALFSKPNPNTLRPSLSNNIVAGLNPAGVTGVQTTSFAAPPASFAVLSAPPTFFQPSFPSKIAFPDLSLPFPASAEKLGIFEESFTISQTSLAALQHPWVPLHHSRQSLEHRLLPLQYHSLPLQNYWWPLQYHYLPLQLPLPPLQHIQIPHSPAESFTVPPV